MKLTFEQIRQITLGAVRLTEHAEGVRFHRFTEEQEERYEQIAGIRRAATAGVRLSFRTDSARLYMRVRIEKASSRDFFSHDLFVDGRMAGSLENGPDRFRGVFEKSFDLGAGEKDVCIHFPWSVCSALQELSLDDGSAVIPVRPAKKILIFGDSISQGYDAVRPSNRYAARLADALGAEEINKAVGGEKFCPWLAATREDLSPDFISVAYGTNHWHNSTPAGLARLCGDFFDALADNYPYVPVFALTPIWRRDRTDVTRFDCFEQIEAIIADAAARHPNVRVISCRNFVPERSELFSDGFLHPNDEGFAYYSDGLIRAVRGLAEVPPSV